MFRWSLLTAVFVLATLPPVLGIRDFELDPAAPDGCEAKQAKLRKMQSGLRNLLEARTRISILIRANWMRFFAGTQGKDTESSDRVRDSLTEQDETLRALTVAGRRREKELLEAVQACDSFGEDASATADGRPPEGGDFSEHHRVGPSSNSGYGLQKSARAASRQAHMTSGVG
uniref:Uncharacterized protein n=1 Tax=Alexandrium monilatum TaxID=311494 RepID=A0A7S4UBF8_9DINO|mmetsp:Transcript_15036/g.47163  ORF Transcript_15036/g.47163 Transcript_15036/m.47163 type:complete len:173 (-) Transcript_15036:32-550(-)